MSGKAKAIVKLLRVKQWYKNFVIFLGPIFGGMLFNPSSYPTIIFGFIICSLASSSNYVVNDLIDLEKDKQHPEKARSRPLASGEVSKGIAIVLAVVLIVFPLGLSLLFQYEFFISVLLIVLTGELYNLSFKHHAILDITSLAMIYEWRAIAGCYIIGLFVSPWLFILVFLAAMFLVISKRKADLDLLGEKADEHKRVYSQYNKELLNQLVTIVACALFIVYCVYAIIGSLDVEEGALVVKNRVALVFSIPVAMYLILRYMALLHTQPEIARRTEKAFKDRGLLIAGLVLLLIWIIALYVEPVYVEWITQDPRV